MYDHLDEPTTKGILQVPQLPSISQRAGGVAALVVAAGLVLSGCGQVRAGAAAIVGDQRIDVQELSDTVAAFDRAAGQSGLQVRDRAALVRGELSRKINGIVLDAAADSSDITVTRGDVDRRIAAAGGRRRLERQALRYGAPPGELRDFIRNQILRKQLAQSLAGGSNVQQQSRALVKKLGEAARRMGVTVSPRYGTFSASKLQVVPEKSALSTPDSSGSQTGMMAPGMQGGRG